MKTKNAEQFVNHVKNLQTIAGLDSYEDAVLLYKKLHRIEVKCNRLFTDDCNGTSGLTEEQTEQRDAKLLNQVKTLMPGLKTIFLNGDPRGYSLKIKESEAKELRDKGINFYTDWGGYGILAPEF